MTYGVAMFVLILVPIIGKRSWRKQIVAWHRIFRRSTFGVCEVRHGAGRRQVHWIGGLRHGQYAEPTGVVWNDRCADRADLIAERLRYDAGVLLFPADVLPRRDVAIPVDRWSYCSCFIYPYAGCT